MDFIARRVPGLAAAADCEIVRADPTKWDDEPEMREQVSELREFKGTPTGDFLYSLHPNERDRIVVESPDGGSSLMSEGQVAEAISTLVARGHEIDNQVVPLRETVKAEAELAVGVRATARANKGSKNHKAALI